MSFLYCIVVLKGIDVLYVHVVSMIRRIHIMSVFSSVELY